MIMYGLRGMKSTSRELCVLAGEVALQIRKSSEKFNAQAVGNVSFIICMLTLLCLWLVCILV
jgi:hypothetical protein